MSSEGPCLTHLKFYDTLDDLCDRFQFDKDLIEIESSNLCEAHPRYRVRRNMNFWELEKVTQNGAQSCEKVFSNGFKHFGHFVGHANKYRIELASYLRYQHGNSALQSFHCDRRSDYHREFLGIEDMIHNGKDKKTIDMAIDLIYDAPIKLDPVSQYPILQPANFQVSKYYKDFFVEIVCLSFFSGRVFYIDEKIWRPILLKTPFMVQGPQNFIRNLQKIGFKTFDSWWDEGYSEDPDDCQTGAIMRNCDMLAGLGITELKRMYEEMQPILEHNFNRLFEIQKNDFYLDFL